MAVFCQSISVFKKYLAQRYNVGTLNLCTFNDADLELGHGHDFVVVFCPTHHRFSPRTAAAPPSADCQNHLSPPLSWLMCLTSGGSALTCCVVSLQPTHLTTASWASWWSSTSTPATSSTSTTSRGRTSRWFTARWTTSGRYVDKNQLQVSNSDTEWKLISGLILELRSSISPTGATF